MDRLALDTITRQVVDQLAVRDFALVCAQPIVRAGGRPVADSEGRSIYPHRIDHRVPHVLWDPHIRRDVRVRVRVRVTVEIEDVGVLS